MLALVIRWRVHSQLVRRRRLHPLAHLLDVLLLHLVLLLLVLLLLENELLLLGLRWVLHLRLQQGLLLRLLVHAGLRLLLLLLVRHLLLLSGLELLLLILLEAKHLLLLLQVLGLLLLRLLVSLVVHHLNVAEAEVAHLELSILLASEIILVLGWLLAQLGEVWLALVVILLDVDMHRLGMLQIHLTLWRLLDQTLDLAVLLAHEQLLLLQLLLHQGLLVLLRLLLTLELALELLVVHFLLDGVLVGRLVGHVVVGGQLGWGHVLLGLRLRLLALVVGLRLLVLLQLLELDGVLQLHALIGLALELHVDWLRLAGVVLLLLWRLHAAIEGAYLDLLRDALSYLLLVFLLWLSHYHCLVLELALIVGHLQRLGLVDHVNLLLELQDLLLGGVKLGLLLNRSLLVLLVLLVVRLSLRLSLRRLALLQLLLRHDQLLLVLLILDGLVLLQLLVLVLGARYLVWHHHWDLLRLRSAFRVLLLTLHLLRLDLQWIHHLALVELLLIRQELLLSLWLWLQLGLGGVRWLHERLLSLILLLLLLETGVRLSKQKSSVGLVLLHLLLRLLLHPLTLHLELLLGHGHLLHLLLLIVGIGCLLLLEDLLLHLLLLLGCWLLLLLGLRLRNEGLLHLLVVLHHVVWSLLLAGLVEVLLLFQVFVDLGQVQRDVLGLAAAVGVHSLDVGLLLQVLDVGRKLVLYLSDWRLRSLWLLLHLGWLLFFGLLLVEGIQVACVLVVLGVSSVVRSSIFVLIASCVALLLVLLQDCETIWQLENWLLHLEVEDALVLAIH